MRWKPKNSTKMVEAYQRPKAFKKARDIFFFWLAILPFDSGITPLGDFEKNKEMKEWNLEEIHPMAFQSSCSAQVVGGWHIGSRRHWPELATWNCWGRANTVFVRQTGENKSHQ